jgi:hypothetical protein
MRAPTLLDYSSPILLAHEPTIEGVTVRIGSQKAK